LYGSYDCSIIRLILENFSHRFSIILQIADLDPLNYEQLKLYIKNMVCSRCKMVLKSELEKAGLHPVSVELGEVEIEEDPGVAALQELNNSLKALGFEIIDDRKSRIIEKIKNAIVEIIHYPNEDISVNVSEYISQKLHYDYSYLSNLF
jgi:copper chaperone CopZ